MKLAVVAEPGDLVHRVVALATSTARVTGRPVQVSFNDRKVWARPGADDIDLVERLLPPARCTCGTCQAIRRSATTDGGAS